jgi:hypothetical protein
VQGQPRATWNRALCFNDLLVLGAMRVLHEAGGCG